MQRKLRFRSTPQRRRDFLRGVSLASLAAGSLSWSDLVSVHAADLRRRGMACILLWMQGGPSQLETFDPKPNHENGGETKTIKTAVQGIEIADKRDAVELPEVSGRIVFEHYGSGPDESWGRPLGEVTFDRTIGERISKGLGQPVGDVGGIPAPGE